MVHTGHAEPSGHSDCLLGHSGHFGKSHDMRTQSFENSQKTVLCYDFVVDLCMKEWFARGEHTWNLLFSDQITFLKPGL
jgi:hypothetical protein